MPEFGQPSAFIEQSEADLALFTTIASPQQEALLKSVQSEGGARVYDGQTYSVRTSRHTDQVVLTRYSRTGEESLVFNNHLHDPEEHGSMLVCWNASSDIKDEQRIYVPGFPAMAASSAVLVEHNPAYNYHLTAGAQELASRRMADILYGAELAYGMKKQADPSDSPLPVRAIKAVGRLVTRAAR